MLASAAFKQLGSAVVISDAERKIQTWNRRAQEMFGYSSEDAFGRLTSDLLKGAPGLAEQVRSLLESSGSWQGEAEVQQADGETVHCMVSVAKVTLSDGESAGFSMVFTDITEIMEARRRLRFQAGLLSQVHNAVIATDLNGAVTYWNPSAERIYGWTSEEAIGRSIVELTVPSPDLSR